MSPIARRADFRNWPSFLHTLPPPGRVRAVTGGNAGRFGRPLPAELSSVCSFGTAAMSRTARRGPRRYPDGWRNRAKGRYHCAMNAHDAQLHEVFLRRAVALSARSLETGEGGPFGAVLARDGKVLAEGWNRVIAANDPTAHAEVLVIREACRVHSTFRLDGAILYASCEPCPMCLAAAYWAGVARIYYANTRNEAAAIGFCDAELYRELALPGEARRVPACRIPLEGAFEPMERWAATPGRILY